MRGKYKNIFSNIRMKSSLFVTTLSPLATKLLSINYLQKVIVQNLNDYFV